MKFARFITLAALVAMSAVVVNAGSIKPKAESGGSDPKLTINKPGPSVSNFAHSLACAAGVQCFSAPNGPGLTSSDPLTIQFSPGGTALFEYTGTKDLTIGPGDKYKFLYVEILGPIPNGTGFSCGGTAFLDCALVFENGSPNQLVDFSGGTLFPGETLSASLQPLVGETPEPSTLLMFLSLGPAIGFAKKRWNAKQSA